MNKIICFLLLPVIFLLTDCRKKENPVSEEQYEKTRRSMADVNRIMIRKDRQRILGYINRHELHMKETASGLWYVVLKSGSDKLAKKNMQVTIKYKIGLLDGYECYDSEKDGPKTFRIGGGGGISGLEEGILMLSEGASALFIIPPHLAYGLPGDGDRIPGRSIITYYVEVLSLR